MNGEFLPSAATFEDLGNWNTVSSDWVRNPTIGHTGTASAYSRCTFGGGYLTSKDIDTSSFNEIHIEFYYQLDDTESSDFILEYYRGGYMNIASLGGVPHDTWRYYEDTITESIYMRPDFKIRFYTSGLTCGSWGSSEYVLVYDVKISGDREL